MGRRISIRIRYERRSDLVALLALTLLTAILLVYLALQPRPVTARPQALQQTVYAPAPRRGYYLTQNMVVGSQVLAACIAGSRDCLCCPLSCCHRCWSLAFLDHFSTLMTRMP